MIKVKVGEIRCWVLLSGVDWLKERRGLIHKQSSLSLSLTLSLSFL